MGIFKSLFSTIESTKEKRKAFAAYSKQTDETVTVITVEETIKLNDKDNNDSNDSSIDKYNVKSVLRSLKSPIRTFAHAKTGWSECPFTQLTKDVGFKRWGTNGELWVGNVYISYSELGVNGNVVDIEISIMNTLVYKSKNDVGFSDLFNNTPRAQKELVRALNILSNLAIELRSREKELKDIIYRNGGDKIGL